MLVGLAVGPVFLGGTVSIWRFRELRSVSGRYRYVSGKAGSRNITEAGSRIGGWACFSRTMTR